MKLIYSELYGLNKNQYGNCFPSIEIHYTDNEKFILPNLKPKTTENEDLDFNISYLIFSYGLFESLSSNTIEKLNSIFNFSKEIFGIDYINKDIWKPFLLTSNIKLNPIKKIINSNISAVKENNGANKGKFRLQRIYTKDSNQLIVEKYYSDNNVPFDDNIHQLQTKLYTNLKNKFLTDTQYEKQSQRLKLKYKLHIPNNIDVSTVGLMRSGFWGGAINIDYEIEFTNELDLLYSFLDCIFSSEYNFCIKKCNNCPTYFIALKTDTKHCPNCKNIIIKSRKAEFEKSNIVKLERKINSLYTNYYAKEEEREEYYKEKRVKKALYQNDEKALKDWYLKHYKNSKSRERNDYIIK